MSKEKTPITQDPNFCAELQDGVMDFSKLENKQFIVAVSTGDRNKCRLLSSTIHGPFEFFEMVENVGCMYEREQHHAKVIILNKQSYKTVQQYDKRQRKKVDVEVATMAEFLDEGTIDYIEANWMDMIATGILEAAIARDDDDYLEAGLLVGDDAEE